jgi:hypothetical protein
LRTNNDDGDLKQFGNGESDVGAVIDVGLALRGNGESNV